MAAQFLSSLLSRGFLLQRYLPRLMAFALVAIFAVGLAISFRQFQSVASKKSAADPVQRDYWPTQDWRVASPESQGMNADVLQKMQTFIKVNRPAVYSVLV